MGFSASNPWRNTPGPVSPDSNNFSVSIEQDAVPVAHLFAEIWGMETHLTVKVG